MQITNNTLFDSELLNDTVKILTRRYKILVAAVEAIFVIMACYYGFSSKYTNKLSLVAVPLMGFIAVTFIGAIRINNYKKMMLQRVKVLNHQETVQCHYEIDEEKSVITTARGTNTLYHNDIKKVHETEKQYLIIYSGGVFSIIAKAGFEDDGEENFRNIMIKKK